MRLLRHSALRTGLLALIALAQSACGRAGAPRPAALPEAGPRTTDRVVLKDVVEVRASSTQACARTVAGEVRCWSFGERPRTVVVESAVQLAVGLDAACALDADNAVSCWTRREGARYQALGRDEAVEIAAAGRLFCARRPSGAVTCWGGSNEVARTQRSFSRPAVALRSAPGRLCALHEDAEATCIAVRSGPARP